MDRSTRGLSRQRLGVPGAGDPHTAGIARMKEAMATPLIIDGRNLYDPEGVARHGFEYVSIGRLPVDGA